jgi:tetratricopeptide (TPR) repeat protein
MRQSCVRVHLWSDRLIHSLLFVIAYCAFIAISGSAGAQAVSKDDALCMASDSELAIRSCSVIIQEGTKTGPDLSAVFYNRGNAHRSKGDYDRAIQDYDEALRIEPDDEDILNNRGVAYRSKGQIDRAIQDYDRAIQLRPDDAIPQPWYCVCLQR